MPEKEYKKIIAMILVQDKEHLEQLLSKKQFAFVLPGTSLKELNHAIRIVSKGEQYISTRVGKYIMDNLVLQKMPDDIFKEKLTSREIEIIELITEGLTSKKIAGKLNISMNTTDTHRRNIWKKLGITNTVALVKYALSRKK